MHNITLLTCVVLFLFLLGVTYVTNESFISLSSFSGDKDDDKKSKSSSFGGGKKLSSMNTMSGSMGKFTYESIDTKIARIKNSVNEASVQKDIRDIVRFQHMFGFSKPCITGNTVGNSKPTTTTCSSTSNNRMIWTTSSQSPEECFATLIPIAEDHRCDMKQTSN